MLAFTTQILYLLFFTTLYIAVASTSSDKDDDAPPPPNIIILFADNLGYDDIGIFQQRQRWPTATTRHESSSSSSPTPNIDRLGEQGKTFYNWNSAAALCSASRAVLLTGKYPVRTGVYPRVFKPGAVYGLLPNETTLANLLQNEGYATSIVGKWHLGHRREYLPTTHHGFDEWIGIPYHMSGGSVDGHVCHSDTEEKVWLPLYQNETIIQQPVHLPTIAKTYADSAVRFMNESIQNENKPFFLYLPFSHVHQLCAPRDFPEQEACQWSSNLNATFATAVQEMDWIAGQVLDFLDANETTKNNTLVLFTSDNGPWVAEQACAGSKGPFQGEWLKHNIQKACTACPHDYVPSPTLERPRLCVLPGSPKQQLDLDGVHCGEDTGLGGVWEANMRMPALARFPGKITAGSETDALVSTLDVLPTVMSTVRGYVPEHLDGIDISDVLYGESDYNKDDGNDRMLFYWRDGFQDGPLPPPFGRFDVAAARYGNLKAWFWTKSAHYNQDVEQFHDPPLLFDVMNDPGESFPLDPAEYDIAIYHILEAVKNHKEAMDWMRPLALATDPKYIPCVDPGTGCRTHGEEGEEALSTKADLLIA